MKMVALATGASAGIGEATVKRLIEQGYTTYAAARRLDRMAGLEKSGAILLPLDLTDDASIVQAVDRIRTEQGRIDVLLNNAGYGSYGAVEDVPLDEARRQFEVNVFGLARLIQLVTPLMRTQIALDNLQQTSGHTVYRPQAEEKHALFLAAPVAASDPDVVAREIVRAIQATRPKTRYVVGAGAKPLVFIASFLPDRFNDWFMGTITQYLVKQQRRKSATQTA
jgi:hypothetical protein